MNEAAFRLELPGFEGTIEELRQARTNGAPSSKDVQVAAVTQAFREHLAESGGIDLEEAGLFLQAASALALAKSRALLPQAEPEEDVEDAPRRERAQVDPLDVPGSSAWLQERQGTQLYGGESRVAGFPRISEPRSVAALARAWEDVRKRSAEASTRVAAPAFVRLEVALSGLIRRLRSSPRVSLRRLLRGATRQEAVIHFLAVLELVRRRQAAAVQKGLFDDIEIEALAEDVDSGARAG